MNTPKNPYLSQATPKKYLLKLSCSKKSWDRKFETQKILWSYHRRPKLITWTRTWLLLASGVVLQTVIYKGLYGIDQFFLKEIKNVMFLNKIDVPYCLVVFFVVCPRLRPFWSVFGELALFWCPTAKRKKRQNSDSRSVRRSRRIIPLENYSRHSAVNMG